MDKERGEAQRKREKARESETITSYNLEPYREDFFQEPSEVEKALGTNFYFTSMLRSDCEDEENWKSFYSLFY